MISRKIGSAARPPVAPLDPREMVRAANRAPLHAGAERYYRERGWLP